MGQLEGFMATKTVILHGWSDCSASFRHIKSLLEAEGLGPADTIFYADYESREDDLTYNDTIDGLNDALSPMASLTRKARRWLI